MKKTVKVLIHVIFWIMMSSIIFVLLYLFTAILPKTQEYNPFTDIKLYRVALTGIAMMLVPFYLAYFILPVFLRKPKLVYLLGLVIIGLYVFILFIDGNNSNKHLDAAIQILILSFIFLIGCLFRILTEWFNNLKLKSQLEKQNLQSELALLKNQINPHFFFNTLNSIDSLIKTNTDRASETLVKLSEIMRYMIYDTNTERVLLSNEISNIENYIDLQKIQFANKDLVTLKIKGNPKQIRIAPMLFIPFVENAFKHCTDKSLPEAIRFSFVIEDNKINFESTNRFNKSKNLSKDPTSGIGLKVIKRRLEILYPNKHKLFIGEEDGEFNVTLSIIEHEN